jgi:hypothetical protein
LVGRAPDSKNSSIASSKKSPKSKCIIREVDEEEIRATRFFSFALPLGTSDFDGKLSHKSRRGFPCSMKK